MENELGMPTRSTQDDLSDGVGPAGYASQPGTDPANEAWARIRGRLREDVGEV